MVGLVGFRCGLVGWISLDLIRSIVLYVMYSVAFRWIRFDVEGSMWLVCFLVALIWLA